jgi:hypothetical protein
MERMELRGCYDEPMGPGRKCREKSAAAVLSAHASAASAGLGLGLNASASASFSLNATDLAYEVRS